MSDDVLLLNMGAGYTDVIICESLSGCVYFIICALFCMYILLQAKMKMKIGQMD